MWITILCGVICGSILLFGLGTRNYQKEYLSQLAPKAHQLRILYPMCLWLLLRTPLGNCLENKQEQKALLAHLHIGEDSEEMQMLHWCKKMAVCVLTILGSAFLCLVLSLQDTGAHNLKEQRYLERQQTGEGSKSVEVQVEGKGKEAANMVVEVPEQAYTEEEARQKIDEAKSYVEDNFLGSNESKEKVCTNLCLVSEVPDNAVSIAWSSMDEDIVGKDGTVYNSRLLEPETCEVVAYLSYGEMREEMPFYVNVLPADKINQADWEQAVEEALQKAGEEQATEPYMELPEQVLGETVAYKEPEKEKSEPTLLLVGVVVCIALWIAFEKELLKEYQKRDAQMLLDYPELINKFTLLLSAGMTVKGAWGKIATEYEKKREGQKKRYAYEEWCATWTEMNNGVTELCALEHFGQRAQLMPYLKFSTLLGQNLKKGSKGLIALLEYEAMDAFENRKQNTKRLAEEAGTKMLAPMMVMLALVMAIIMAPALLSI